ncbi:hypothetical protein ADUPG1_009453, partial [Aduncisulcus paluster]
TISVPVVDSSTVQDNAIETEAEFKTYDIPKPLCELKQSAGFSHLSARDQKKVVKRKEEKGENDDVDSDESESESEDSYSSSETSESLSELSSVVESSGSIDIEAFTAALNLLTGVPVKMEDGSDSDEDDGKKKKGKGKGKVEKQEPTPKIDNKSDSDISEEEEESINLLDEDDLEEKSHKQATENEEEEKDTTISVPVVDSSTVQDNAIETEAEFKTYDIPKPLCELKQSAGFSHLSARDQKKVVKRKEEKDRKKREKKVETRKKQLSKKKTKAKRKGVVGDLGLKAMETGRHNAASRKRKRAMKKDFFAGL